MLFCILQCYDLRFPQLSSILTHQFGVQILTYPRSVEQLKSLEITVLIFRFTLDSVFTVPTGKAHWEVLLRARAIENQCYVVAASQVGKHNEKRQSYGYSMVDNHSYQGGFCGAFQMLFFQNQVVDPWGKVIANCEQDSPAFRIAEIDLDYLNQIRSHDLPIAKSLRTDLYLQLPLVKSRLIKLLHMKQGCQVDFSQIDFVESTRKEKVYFNCGF